MCFYWGPQDDCYVPTHGRRPVEAPHQEAPETRRSFDTPLLTWNQKSLDLPKGTMEKPTFFMRKTWGKRMRM